MKLHAFPRRSGNLPGVFRSAAASFAVMTIASEIAPAAEEIVVLGSSVASSTGAATQSEGWAYRMKALLENPPPVVPGSEVVWQVHNASIGGDTTTRVLNRFQNDVVNAHPGTDIVIISLSLANEGLVGSSNPQPVFDSFRNGLAQIISRCRQEGFYPVVTLCYSQNEYNAGQFSFVRRMNVLLNTWDVPSINFLGAIDNGSGHWAPGYFTDAGHPNSAGHFEMYASVVPSLFEAIVSGKTATPAWDGTTGYLRLQRDAGVNAPLSYTPAHAYRSFNLSFRVRSTGTGSIAALGTGAGGATLEMREGTVVYLSPAGQETAIPVAVNDGRWHEIAISHRKAVNQTLVFIDGLLTATVSGALDVSSFAVGGPGEAEERAASPEEADYQDVGIYRAAWTEDEALAQSRGALQQASLDVLATLDDAAPAQGAELDNRAQSFSALTLQTGGFTASLAPTTPDGLSGASYRTATVSLDWTDHAGGAAAFTIERRRTGVAESWTVAGTGEGGVTFFEDTGLLAGVSYDYRVSVAEGALQGDYSNVVSIAAAGQDSVSYHDWIRGYYPEEPKDDAVFLIDFNVSASPSYDGRTWNTVSSRTNPAPYVLRDSNDNLSGYTVAITDGFDQDRNDNGSPLADYPAAAQISQFALRDDSPLTGAITFSGLDPEATYDFSFFARRGSLVGGFDYSGTYTFTGGGDPVSVVVNAASNTAMTHVPKIQPSAAGVVTLTVTAGPGAGTDFPVINFIKFNKSTPGVYLVDLNTNANPNYGLIQWNTVASRGITSVLPLQDIYGSASDYAIAVSDGFDQFRDDNGAPLGDYAPVAQATHFALRDDNPLSGALTFSGLDPAKSYDFTFFARRGPIVGGFDYSGVYTFAGAGAPVVVEANAASNTTLTRVPPVTPDASGAITLTITSGAGSGQRFPALNFIRFSANQPSEEDLSLIDPGADPDEDGMSNFEEYARGFDPTVPDHASFLAGHFSFVAGQGPRLEISRDLRARDADLILQTSTHLSGWEEDTGALRSVIRRNGAVETLLFESSHSDDPSRFYRFLLVPAGP